MKRNFLYILVLLGLILAACGTPATATPAPATEPTTTGTGETYTPVSTDVGKGTITSAGFQYSVEGANKVTSEKLENDIVRLVIDGNLVQGGARYPLSIYQGEYWAGTAKFDGINTNLEVMFNTTCTGAEDLDLSKSIDVTLTCVSEEHDWKIIVKFHVAVLTTTTVIPAAPQATAIEWQNLDEGKWYLFCIAPGTWGDVKYVKEGGISEYTDGNDCLAGKLLNKLAYRVQTYSKYDEKLIVATLFPENAPGAYPFLTSDKLLVGRTYFVCNMTETEIPYVYTQYDTDYDRTIDLCMEGVYMGKDETHHHFDTGEDIRFSLSTFNGAFPSPNP